LRGFSYTAAAEKRTGRSKTLHPPEPLSRKTGKDRKAPEKKKGTFYRIFRKAISHFLKKFNTFEPISLWCEIKSTKTLLANQCIYSKKQI
jgi:hypothetical protein